MGQSTETVELANIYLDIMLWAIFPAVGFSALRSIVSALSQARPVTLVVVLGTIFNIIGNYVLGFGKFGFPEMGMAGLALASVLSWWGMFIALAIYVFKQEKLHEYRIFHNLHKIQPRILQELAWLGIPIGLFTGLESGFFMAITFLMGLLGTEMLAAHQIVFQTIVVVFMIPLGISYATTVRVGQWLGKRDKAGVRQAALVSAVVTTILTLTISISFLLFPQRVIGIYLDLQNPDNEAIASIAIPLLIIASIAQVIDGLQKAVYGSLQGLQDTQIPMLLNIIGYWGVGLSLGYLLSFQFGLGGVGLWLGQSIAILSVAALFIWRFVKLLSRQKFTTDY